MTGTSPRAAWKAIARREGAQAARIVIAAAVSWQICIWLGAQSAPVFAVIVPLVSLRDDTFSALHVSLSRLVGVVAGVALAALVLEVLEPNLLAMVLVLGLGLTAGILLRLGAAMNIQVAVSALLVFTSVNVTGYGLVRLWETGVGTLVTLVLAPFLFPGNPLAVARREIDRLADGLTTVLRDAIATAGAPELGSAERTRRLAQANQPLDAIDASIGMLAGHIAAARKSAPWTMLWRRQMRRVAELGPMRELAVGLAADLRSFVEESMAFAARAEYATDPDLRHDRLTAVGQPLAVAMRAALRGEPFRAEIEQAHAAVRAFATAEHSHVASVVRRPLHRMVDLLYRAGR